MRRKTPSKCAGRLRPGGKAAALARGYKAWPLLKRPVLLLDILLDDLQRRPAATGGKVTRTPELVSPVVPRDVGALLPQHPAGNPLHAAYQGADGNLGVVLHKKVDVVFLAVALHHLRLEVIGYAPEVFAQPLDGVAIKHTSPVFGHEDQMHMHCKNTMPA